MSTPLNAEPSVDILRRICAEYAEMPGLRLTHQQAQRLWGLDADTSLAVLQRLTQIGFLYRTPDAQYARLTDGPATLPRFHMAKAQLHRTKAGRIAI